MLIGLGIVFLILILLVGGERGAVSFISLAFNSIILILAILIMASGISPYLVTVTLAFMVGGITLIYQNGSSIKTWTALIASITVTIGMAVLSAIVVKKGQLSGLDEIEQKSDYALYYDFNLQIDMRTIYTCVIIIGMLGAVIDTAIAVTSALYEVALHHPYLTQMELYKSGMTIGKDILGTTMNTLCFAYLGEALMMFLYMEHYEYSFLQLINSKAVLQDLSCILLSAIGCVLTVPVSARIAAIGFELYKEEIQEQKNSLL